MARLSDFGEAARGELQSVKEGLQAARGLDLAMPSHAGVSRRYAYGFTLPFVLVARVLREPSLRPSYLRATLPICAAIVAIGVTMFTVSTVRDFFGPVESGVHIHRGGVDLDLGDDEATARQATRFRRWTQSISKIYATLVIAETVLLALSRSNWSKLTTHASEMVGTVRHPDPIGAWARLKRRVRRRLRGLIILAWMSAPFGLVGPELASLASLSFGYYWLSVYALGTSGAAWAVPPREPFFLRGGARLARVPVVSWIARPYFGVLRWLTRPVCSPCAAFESRPSESLGFGLARALCFAPLVNSLTRPLLPVAAQLILKPLSSSAATPPA